MKPLYIVTTFTLLMSFLYTNDPSLYAQSHSSITGHVYDQETGEPLISVNVIIRKTILGASTDQNGNFTIERIPPGTYSLDISMMGYESRMFSDIPVQSGETTHLKIPLRETVLTINPVVVTAEKHPQSLSVSTQAVNVLPLPRIAERQSRNFEEALQTISGVHFNESNISIRGSSGYNVINVGSRVLFMVDGVPVLTSDLGAINWGMLPMLDIDHIEVVKGAGSALYGSSAIGGVVNIITRSPSTKGHLQIRTLAGIYDQPHYPAWRWTDQTLHYERADIAYGRRIGPVSFRMSCSRYVSTGYMENNEIHQWNATGKFVWHFPNHARFDLYTAWMSSKMGWLIQWLNQNRPFEVPPFNKEDELDNNTLTLYSQLYLPFSARFGLKLRISHLVSQMGSQFSVNDPSVFKPGQGTGCEIQANWIPFTAHHITIGNEFRWDLSGSKYFGDHKGYTLSPYLQDEWTLFPNLTAIFGFRLDRHVLIDETTDTQYSPKIGLNCRPFKDTVLRASLGKGFRAATVLEKYMKADYSGINVIPNPDLQPERSWFYDIGIRQNFGTNGNVELSFFHTDYWNMIEPVINFLGTIQFQNYIRAQIRGIELSSESWWFRQHLGLAISATWMDPRDIDRDEVLPYRPEFVCNLRGTLKFGPATLQAEYHYASRIEEVEINPLDPRVALKLLHIRGQVHWGLITFQCAVHNALNYHYTQIERRMGEIRNVSLGILIDWGN
jgi:outer membrane receptor protein involved in Fe transport